MNIKRNLGIFLIIIGLSFILTNLTITGDAIGFWLNRVSGLIGIIVLIGGILLYFAKREEKRLERIVLTSSIKKSPFFKKAAENATRNERVQKEMNHLIYQLSQGNLQAGLGEPGHVPETNIYYLRGRNGARLFYRQIANGYETVAKSDKQNENEVIRRIRKEYKN